MKINRFRNYPLKLKLMLVPSISVASFVAYLIYSSLVLSGGNALLKEIRDAEFPILNAAGENLKSFEGVVESLNAAAATGEVDYLEASKAKSSEILSRYESMEEIDTAHTNEIEKLKSDFNAFYSLAFNVAQRMMAKKDLPSQQQIKQLRDLRNAYTAAATSYRDTAEKEFQETIRKAIGRSETAQGSGAIIGTFMLFVIGVLTLLVNRGIVVLEKVVENRNKMLVLVNSELEQEIQKLKAAEAARSSAEAASHIKDEFLANMSHELRTPMNAVIGLSHLCLQTELSGKQQDYLQKIHSSAKSLLGILNDILDVSKIEAGKMELDRIPFELDDVMDNLATILGVKAQEKNLELLIETSPDVPSVLIGDPLRLGQVLINLAGNAVKFTPKGEVVVSAELEKEEGDQVFLRFTVKDTGIGMSQPEIEKLFRPFTQADTSITRKFGGTGLGLTISKRLIEIMGGKIWVESTPGLGSKFIFTVSCFKAEQQADIPHTEFTGLGGMRVLAVDDSENSLLILKNYLESFSFDVSVANNGRDALSTVRKANKEGRPFNLAILDWKMPQMSGLELARELREMPELTVKPKVLMIAGYGQSGIPALINDKVIDGVLEKPFKQKKLFDSIANIFGLEKWATGKFRIIGAQFNPALVAQVRGAYLLLVEDNEINQQVARELLESFGIRVAMAENGEEAIARLQEEPFDGVLMDMQMPVMDGITATREIRKNPALANLPIIALTANVYVSEQNAFLAAGMNDHIGKPLDPDRLIATLAKWIHPARLAESASPPPVAAASAPVSLPDLPGVKVAESVRRIGGNIGLYYSLLEKFRINQKDAARNIRDALASNDPKTAERLAHTLRGIAGTLGAEYLQAQAEILENKIKNGAFDEVESLIGIIDRELGRLMTNIGRALDMREG
ncbi:signal transduction histidine-protein kinase BarA [mine drainage metagenome]|uniref:histidine kinase n=1 Tax=mine drainage metagenome TaxID=410659 RepID=A0A1J5T2Z3_9ZZZZ